jgi:hypothetical protein
MANELTLVSLLATPVISLFAVYLSVELCKRVGQLNLWG